MDPAKQNGSPHRSCEVEGQAVTCVVQCSRQFYSVELREEPASWSEAGHEWMHVPHRMCHSCQCESGTRVRKVSLESLRTIIPHRFICSEVSDRLKYGCPARACFYVLPYVCVPVLTPRKDADGCPRIRLLCTFSYLPSELIQSCVS